MESLSYLLTEDDDEPIEASEKKEYDDKSIGHDLVTRLHSFVVIFQLFHPQLNIFLSSALWQSLRIFTMILFFWSICLHRKVTCLREVNHFSCQTKAKLSCLCQHSPFQFQTRKDINLKPPLSSEVTSVVSGSSWILSILFEQKCWCYECDHWHNDHSSLRHIISI